ncbi:hypothetical protein, partial [Paraburkholderia nemoris]|uniref:hypothetical protein n=1 Tax=Paraburkholderia nemoris TaxID=2793076 RepID=UPI001B8B48D3
FEFERVLRPLCLDRHRFFSLLEFTHSARDSFFGGKVTRLHEGLGNQAAGPTPRRQFSAG